MSDIADAVKALGTYQQLDMEGVMVGVSRQAVEEVLAELKRLQEAAATIRRLREKLVRDGSGCGCHWTYKDLNDSEGTRTKECGYHYDQRNAARASTIEECAKVVRNYLAIYAAEPPEEASDSRVQTVLESVEHLIRQLKDSQ